MRLLDTKTGMFKVVNDPRTVHYATLSHVWSKPEDPNYIPECSYADVMRLRDALPDKGSQAKILHSLPMKVQNACKIARDHGYRYLWNDTCCIDQSSSADLSEAINSMYEWYAHSKVCYAYLDDVNPGERARSEVPRSRWFGRGWTLQELIAPRTVIFLASDWTPIATKHMLADSIESWTGIDADVLRYDRSIQDVCVAKRMYWASRRITTRLEDEAYSLIGIFGVHMTTIYGEGRGAFLRLQLAILQQVPDQTIFIWGLRQSDIVLHSDDGKPTGVQPVAVKGFHSSYLLASSPSDFAASNDVSNISIHALQQALSLTTPMTYPEYTTTSYGIRTTFPIKLYTSETGETRLLAFLACQDKHGRLLALVLRPCDPTDQASIETYVGTLHMDQSPTFNFSDPSSFVSQVANSYIRLAFFTRETIDALPESERAEVNPIYIRYNLPLNEKALFTEAHEALSRCPSLIAVNLAPWCKTLLSMQRYIVSASQKKGHDTRAIEYTLTHGADVITIQIAHCTCASAPSLTGGRNGALSLRVITPKGERLGPRPPISSNIVQGGRLACLPDHVESWVNDGIASKTFRLPSSTSLYRCLRITLSCTLTEPITDSHTTAGIIERARSDPGKYILEVEVLDDILLGGDSFASVLHGTVAGDGASSNDVNQIQSQCFAALSYYPC